MRLRLNPLPPSPTPCPELPGAGRIFVFSLIIERVTPLHRKGAMHKLLCLLVVFAAFTSLAAAYEFNWQYIGHPLSSVVCAIEDPLDSAMVRVGCYCPWDNPLSGGVYVHHDPDTTWSFGGLRGHRVFSLRTFPYCRPGQLFASTDQGLYVFNRDTMWTLLNNIGIMGGTEQVDFVISPYDTSLWIITIESESGGSAHFVSRNGGLDWTFFSNGHGTFFSRTDANTIYYCSGGLWRTNIADSTFEEVLSPVDRAIYHPTQPWVYGFVFSSLARYDEVTGDTMRVIAPSETELWDINYSEGEGLFVATSAGLYRVTDDLLTWEACTDSISVDGVLIICSSRDRYVALGWENTIYTMLRTPSFFAEPKLQPPSSFLTIPNPFNATTQIRYSVPREGHVSVRVFDVLGREVCVLVDEVMAAGEQRVVLDGSALASGIYFVRLSAGEMNATRKVLLVR
jgi:hypothetical protein